MEYHANFFTGQNLPELFPQVRSHALISCIKDLGLYNNNNNIRLLQTTDKPQ